MGQHGKKGAKSQGIQRWMNPIRPTKRGRVRRAGRGWMDAVSNQWDISAFQGVVQGEREGRGARSWALAVAYLRSRKTLANKFTLINVGTQPSPIPPPLQVLAAFQTARICGCHINRVYYLSAPHWLLMPGLVSDLLLVRCKIWSSTGNGNIAPKNFTLRY